MKNMNLTKARLQKIWSINNQTRKKFKTNKKVLIHTNTICNRNRIKQFNLKHNTIKNLSFN
jgi:hypothetical protein